MAFSATSVPLHQQVLSLDHRAWVQFLATTPNVLIIQDLDGVCMELVADPLDRQIDLAYVQATQAFAGHFYVLTNGEHTGTRGVNPLVERAWGGHDQAKAHAGYLPGLAAGGVQWQGRTGQGSHPGVSAAELEFLAAVPGQMRAGLRAFFQQRPGLLAAAAMQQGIEASVLDNLASPTVNLNTLHAQLQAAGDRDGAIYADLQRAMAALMTNLLDQAAQRGLGESFFVHYAPNRGRGADGQEVLDPGTETESGTTDFQFMVRGAIKEAGVLALLNRYYAQHTGEFPLGEGFSVRQAPRSLPELLALAEAHFDPARMPTLVGVGDTVTSRWSLGTDGQPVVQRGGSDRLFLQLIQDLGKRFHRGNLVTYVDSSGGQVKNRKPLKIGQHNGLPSVLEGPGDPRDTTDPLRLNVVFPGGHRQYCAAFQSAAQQRVQST
ncbi:glucosylglycerol 3-phosphatase [Leptolyngbya sp. BL0902]|uniref:glucosylglycerol 3-phosphatase n=1 Tax=Leptolyngbya sp. BL0902 TaxID=1115757 RepID=UPI0018E8193F|nr:glucosylglycerol 3-phosphatase [Leptolyngbya sp. BL0902]QQE66608.1 glucosylglycerol 3-phosphatase [Leptolyngbya sp. BL0902]